MGWKVTATTLRCDIVADFATIMVQPDGTAKCSYVNRYSKAKNTKEKMKGCARTSCPLMDNFKAWVMAMPETKAGLRFQSSLQYSSDEDFSFDL